MIVKNAITIHHNSATLYKRDSAGNVRIYRGEVAEEGGNWFTRTVTGLEDGKQVRSGWRIVEQKNVGRSNETSLEEQAFAEMTADAMKKLERGYFSDIKKVDTFDKIKPMLASKYEDATLVWGLETIFSQPKLDGIRCVARANGLWTRAGKELVSIPHINEELKEFFENYPDAILDGELYNHDLRENFNKITSLVRKTKPTEADIVEAKGLVQYHVYDLISSPEIFSDRMNFLRIALDVPSVEIVDTNKVETADELDDLYGAYLEDGFEGQMVRKDELYQQNKRSKYLIKRKEFLTDEYDVIRVEEGKGNWAGHIKRFVLQTENGQEFGAGVRGNQEVLSALFKSGETPTWCTLRYFAPTPDGIPRFPVIIDWGMGQRED
jgi:DNA ligase-1|tara:strand:+ start:4120 stop:5259 length:1140 start_codon:yes stop_codon:yes gene_type:complete